MSTTTPTPSEVSAVMREMGRRGGLIGGKRRLETMTAAERSAQARKAALARWSPSPAWSKTTWPVGTRFSIRWPDNTIWTGCVIDRYTPRLVYWHYPSVDQDSYMARRQRLDVFIARVNDQSVEQEGAA